MSHHPNDNTARNPPPFSEEKALQRGRGCDTKPSHPLIAATLGLAILALVFAALVWPGVAYGQTMTVGSYCADPVMLLVTVDGQQYHYGIPAHSVQTFPVPHGDISTPRVYYGGSIYSGGWSGTHDLPVGGNVFAEVYDNHESWGWVFDSSEPVTASIVGVSGDGVSGPMIWGPFVAAFGLMVVPLIVVLSIRAIRKGVSVGGNLT